MSDKDKHIEEIELRAAESELIANLATSAEVRAHNVRLSRELYRAAESLRAPATTH